MTQSRRPDHASGGEASIQVHIASKEEQLEAYRQVHEIWSGGRTMAEHMAWRQTSVSHNHAQWWVLTVEGQVASSLGCHPLHFDMGGRRVSGYGIAAVYTPAAHRRRGYADQLCRHVIAHQEAQGDQVGLLFSDIKPSYYQAMGFVPCQNTSWHCTDPAQLASSGPAATLRRIDPRQHMDLLLHAWDAHNQRQPLSLARDAPYWDYSLRRDDEYIFMAIEDDAGQTAGYTRVWHNDQYMAPVECCLQAPNPALYAAAGRAWGAWAAELGLGTIKTWLAPAAGLQHCFTPHTRAKAQTMIRLANPQQVDPQWMRQHMVIPISDHF